MAPPLWLTSLRRVFGRRGAMPFPMDRIDVRDLARRGFTRAEVAETARRMGSVDYSTQFLFTTALLLWAGLLCEVPPATPGRGISPLMARWVGLGEPVLRGDPGAWAHVLTPLLYSVASDRGPGGRDRLRASLAAGAPRDAAAPLILQTHEQWQRLLPPERHGALYLDLVYAGIGFEETTHVLAAQTGQGAASGTGSGLDPLVLEQLRTLVALGATPVP